MNKKKCILCGSTIPNKRLSEYERKLSLKMTRYQSIVDTLIEDGCDPVFFDHDNELAGLSGVYHDVAYLKVPALYPTPKKSRSTRIKEADVCGVKNGKVKVIVEEYMIHTGEKNIINNRIIKDTIKKIKDCHCLIVGEKRYKLAETVLFVVVDKPSYQTLSLLGEDDISKIVICSKNKFREVYKQAFENQQ